jgi:hypothetical protein
VGIPSPNGGCRWTGEEDGSQFLYECYKWMTPNGFELIRQEISDNLSILGRLAQTEQNIN